MFEEEKRKGSYKIRLHRLICKKDNVLIIYLIEYLRVMRQVNNFLFFIILLSIKRNYLKIKIRSLQNKKSIIISNYHL